MSDRISGTAAAAVGAHSKDAMQAAGAIPTPPRPDPAPRDGAADGGENGEADRESSLRGTADRLLSTASDAGDSAVRAARRIGRQARVRGAHAGRAAGGAVRDYPVPALLMAGAAGLALGLLLARR